MTRLKTLTRFVLCQRETLSSERSQACTHQASELDRVVKDQLFPSAQIHHLYHPKTDPRNVKESVIRQHAGTGMMWNRFALHRHPHSVGERRFIEIGKLHRAGMWPWRQGHFFVEFLFTGFWGFTITLLIYFWNIIPLLSPSKITAKAGMESGPTVRFVQESQAASCALRAEGSAIHSCPECLGLFTSGWWCNSKHRFLKEF